MKYWSLSICFLLSIVLCTCTQKTIIKKEEAKSMISIIPQPTKTKQLEGSFKFDKQVGIVILDKSLQINADYLAEWIEQSVGYRPNIQLHKENLTEPGNIILMLDSRNKSKNDEAYQLKINTGQIEIKAKNDTGIFYGIQTLRQLLPIEYQTKSDRAESSWDIPCLLIEDSPRYGWRGMMLDVSRHFFPKEFIKNFIDYLAMYKLNTFHWHLVDDQGWRIEIKKYPKLTEIGAWRVDRENLHWNSRPAQKPGEEATYGGYYTQEEIKEIVAYAKSRHITIVPEIEMPAHVVSALSSYPQYSCNGGPFTVLPGGYWPISDIYCAGNDSTFLFLQDILSEVMEVFPSEYIHIGGDEATKTVWEKCPKCQARIKAENLADEHELQSYFIKRMESFINSNGRKLIGWDEILEGGLAPQAAVMSWRGFEGGITAARSGHPVVMTPTSHCYFDYYQGARDYEPVTIGGFLPLKKVYQFDPTPDDLSNDEAKYILGGQANAWTEYMHKPSDVQYMVFPRITALSEAVWTQKKLKNWDNFAIRAEREMHRYEKLDINYAKSSFRVGFNGSANLDKKQFVVELSSELPQLDIRYTLDGKQPAKDSPKYQKPIVIEKNTTIKAATFRNEEMISPVFSKSLNLHKATGKKVTLKNPPVEKYSGSGDFTLTNSMRGSSNHSDGRWLGFKQVDMEAVIDLGEVISVKKISSSYLNNIKSWIFLPSKVSYAISKDGNNFEPIAVMENEYPENFSENIVKEFTSEFKEKETRYIKIIAKNINICPDWHMGSGGKAWLFCDEVMVD